MAVSGIADPLPRLVLLVPVARHRAGPRARVLHASIVVDGQAPAGLEVPAALPVTLLQLDVHTAFDRDAYPRMRVENAGYFAQ